MEESFVEPNEFSLSHKHKLEVFAMRATTKGARSVFATLFLILPSLSFIRQSFDKESLPKLQSSPEREKGKESEQVCINQLG